ncbi:phytanoyl-CoA dioxygenase family protein [Undibacterium sp. 5I1]|uniref:phytanoyl-CoA dioxygenase family protein n=1 Tax=unclassified Undibacterium TaxID=2630295 RepID=UPI002AB59C6C|nr:MULTISPECIES: phytanoyl-CoA dioxygenase family protein [unclassified Undibacterium]MDY7539348.1 phytanoyl-CoA dioxygenase family protein [Undibacterium sp. 5I1]MEB0231175.1 phytanoyl-CoA dioxygenase family protein [Undibacterium sp. 10I3]MEB0258543.1 phytanoyl-CoA dioxygenase family protein [Undibacterium sp. 5I1]
MLSQEQLQQFQQNGYLVLPAQVDGSICEQMIAFAQQQLASHIAPIEYEADTRYPGAPVSRDAEGGLTARRVLQVIGRSSLVADWVMNDQLVQPLRQILGEGLRLVQSHHNCIMTKQPRFSSVTGWHRDSRYWHFQRAELVSAWLALRDETVENGCLLVIPGSHRLAIAASQLDAALFLRADLSENQSLLAQAKTVPLRQGDVLLFHSNLFHAAGCNQTTQTKFSLVTTYRAADNPPVADTRSTHLDEIAL